MKNKFNIIIIFIFLLNIISCSNNISSSEEEILFETDISYNYENKVENKTYKFNSHYSDEYFLLDSSSFNKDLALTSLIVTMSYDDDTKVLYDEMKFEIVHEYQSSNTSYLLYNKKLNNKNLYSLYFDPYKDNEAWASNMNIGNNGYHEGYYLNASEIYNDLKLFFNGDNSNNIIWLTGYSRGGAITSLISKLLIDNNIFSNTNIYAYCFESPLNSITENKDEYKSIMNIYNEADLIVNFPPIQYGFIPYGTLINIYSSDIDNIINNEYEETYLEPFNNITKEIKFDLDIQKYFYKELLKDKTNYSSNLVLSSREEYVTNYQDTIMYFTKHLNRLDQIEIDDIQELINMQSFIEITLTKNGLFNVIKEYFDNHDISYNEKELNEQCLILINFVKGPTNQLIKDIIINPNIFKRLIQFHYFETTFALVKNLSLN